MQCTNPPRRKSQYWFSSEDGQIDELLETRRKARREYLQTNKLNSAPDKIEKQGKKKLQSTDAKKGLSFARTDLDKYKTGGENAPHVRGQLKDHKQSKPLGKLQTIQSHRA